jgi:hypothetical protein
MKHELYVASDNTTSNRNRIELKLKRKKKKKLAVETKQACKY